MYMGELVRLAILRFTKEGLLFNGTVSEQLRKSGEFLTKYLSKIELDDVGNYKHCLSVLHKLGQYNATYKDCAIVRYICECVSTRSAHLVAAGITTLLNKMNDKSVTVRTSVFFQILSLRNSKIIPTDWSRRFCVSLPSEISRSDGATDPSICKS